MDRNKEAVKLFNKNAQLYQDKYMDVSLYADALDLICTRLPPDAQVLDVACGPGNIIRYLLQQQPGFTITGIDLSTNMIDLAQANNPKAKFVLMDGRDIAKLDQQFDAIICGFGFPYFSKEEAIDFIQDASKRLNKHGLLYISTMEGNYDQSDFQTASTGESVFIYNHQENYLADAFKRSGFTILHTQREDYTGYDGAAVTDLIIVGQH